MHAPSNMSYVNVGISLLHPAHAAGKRGLRVEARYFHSAHFDSAFVANACSPGTVVTSLK